MIKDLTQGSITKNLLKISLPVMGASLFQMAYQITDMFWLGKLSSDAVAAVGTAGFYINLSYALATLAFIGVGIKVSQAVGAKKYNQAIEYVSASIILIAILSIVISLITVIFRNQLIDFFNINSLYIRNGAISYLAIVISFSIFKNLNLTFNRIFIGYGSGRVPLIIGSFSVLLNIILDPIFIFTLDMGIVGAAYATIISQVISSITYGFVLIKYSKINKFQGIKLCINKISIIIKLSYPVTIQRVIFTVISIFIGKIISEWGTDAIAIQKIGIQLESLSWITAGGMQAAITSFIGQNYGAKKLDRLRKGYFSATIIMFGVGAFVTLLFTVFPTQIFSLFVNEPEVISGGANYLKILAISQIFMCIDIMTMGAFNGIGRTGVPPIISVTFTGARIPLSILLSSVLSFGVSGIWFSITLTTILKSTILVILFLYFLKRVEMELKPIKA
ncbi:MAG: MATE family efflux transporter [Spirochaetales bacterium]|nr:MATE family efflux transporter [Spirochaetales bacterium]